MSVIRVKICGLTRETDVTDAVQAGADAIGFVFARGSKRELEPDRAAQLVKMVPAFVARVGLFLDQDAHIVTRTLETVPLNLLQFHGTEDSSYCRQFGMPYIKAISVNSRQDIARAEKEYEDAAGLLLDSHQPGSLGGTGRVFDWSKINSGRLPLILAGGLTVANVAAAIRQVAPWAVDVSSGVEDAPGIKNREAMKKFIEEAKK